MIPRVSVGLAVFNGENFLAEAIESLLSQTFADFELIISDNASADGTQDICRDFASRDTRISYLRQTKNHGAAWNQSEVMRRARCPLFKLATHDDLCRPQFLERCVSALDKHPECVLAYTDSYEMPNGDTSFLVHWHDKDKIDTALPLASNRFRELIRGDQYGYRVFGVIRTHLLLKTRLMGAFHAADHVLMAQLGLLGPFAHVPERLFLFRLHPEQSIHLSFEPKKYVEWWRGEGQAGPVFPTWRYMKELTASVFRIDLPTRERLRCLGHIAAWARRKRALLAAEVFKLQPQTPCWEAPRPTSVRQDRNPPVG